jgi:group II intron reverse transcriptase/maturase
MKTKEKLSLITARVKRNGKEKMTSLAHLINEESLRESIVELKRGKAVGVDGTTVAEYEKNLTGNLEELVRKMKTKEWRPQPVRRVYVPKPGKAEKRGLGIPSTEDKLVQVMVKKILEAIYEPRFYDFSHGFRPWKSCHTAIAELDNILMTKKVNFVVEVDIRKFFDNVSHYWLQRCLEEQIEDPNFLWVIRRLLKAGIMENGKIEPSEQGTPQGGVASAILANIFLHYVLDMWFERKFKVSSRQYMGMVRYCDDFVVMFESRKDAERFLTELGNRFAKFGLAVSEEKTRLIEFGRKAWERNRKAGGKSETFNFLGFTHYATKSRKGHFIVGHKTAKENLRRKLKAMKDWLKGVRNAAPHKVWRPILNAKLIGHYNYFGISGNMRCIQQYYYKTREFLFKWLNRRSQKKSLNRQGYQDYLLNQPLPLPRIRYNLYVLKPVQ